MVRFSKMLKSWLSSIVARETFKSRVAASFPCYPADKESAGSRKDVLRCRSVLGLGEVSSDGAVVAWARTVHCERASQIAGPGWAWTRCCFCFQMQLGRVVFAAHRHSWSRSASWTHGVVFSPSLLSSGLRRNFGRTRCVWFSAGDPSLCMAWAGSYTEREDVLVSEHSE